MAKVIYKYHLEDRKTFISIQSTQILSVIEQDNKVVVYALIDTELDREYEYKFVIVGTGTPTPNDIEKYTYLNTVSTFEGQLIWHVFYRQL